MVAFSNSHVLGWEVGRGVLRWNDQHIWGRFWVVSTANQATRLVYLIYEVTFRFDNKVILHCLIPSHLLLILLFLLFLIGVQNTHVLCLLLSRSWIVKSKHIVDWKGTLSQTELILVDLFQIGIKVEFESCCWFLIEFLHDAILVFRLHFLLLVFVWIQPFETLFKMFHSREALFVVVLVIWIFKDHALGWAVSLRNGFLMRIWTVVQGVRVWVV